MIISIDENKLHEYLKKQFKTKILSAISNQVSGWDTHTVNGWNASEGLWDGFNNGSPIYENYAPATGLAWNKGWLHISHDSNGYPSRWWIDQSGGKKVGRRSLATGVSANVVDDKLSINFVYKIIDRQGDPFE